MAVMQNNIVFGGVNSADYGIYISGEGVFNSPKRDAEFVSVPGRDGDILIDHGRFENINVTYPAFIYKSDLSSFTQNIRNFRNALCSLRGYQRLTDSIITGEFRLATFVDDFEVKPIEYNTAAKFDITFNCKPQRFLTSGETSRSYTANSVTISNPTSFDSKPLITITGTGTANINGVNVNVSASPTTIDCETMECYNGTTSRNFATVFSPNRFPTLSPGSNTITKPTSITRIEITPRWWRI